ncbi:hypothetical protein ANN_06198 [Periplaneta americana]|uniref:Reverse transcriptase domain-containing protein n=1 Tax=Periplaneta americana TaxID=6978 RepID=A0ABQ8TEH4_PERAM|nr:hypothetical protein ANN_06198 [Periplaneta americana]
MSEVRSQLAVISKGKWEWTTTSKGTLTKVFFPSVQDRLKLKIQVTPDLTTLLTGHGRLNAYFHRFKMKISATCVAGTGHSTTTALLKVNEDVRQASDERKLTLLVLLDFSKAFDTVDTEPLSYKLRQLNLSDAAVTWFDSFGRCNTKSSLADFDRTISSLTSVPGNVGDEKTANILSKNPGNYQLKEIQDILQEKTHQKPTKFSIEQLTAFVQAPLTSCDVERSFSHYKAMLRDNRRRMTTENIRHCLVVNCNSINGAFSNEASTSKSIN